LGKNKAVVIGAFLLLLPRFAGGDVADAPVRIGVLMNAAAAKVGPGRYSATDARGRTEPLVLNVESAVAPKAGGVQIGGRLFSGHVTLDGDGAFLRLNNKPFRGRLELRRGDGGRLTAVNILPVEDYVRGILLHEVSPEWPAESLKAQAVISRTYALHNRGRHASDGYDLCNVSHCQVYGGQGSERDTIDRAVNATRGEVIVHGGELVGAVFHSNCGGATEESDAVWEGGPSPYLKSVRCGYCRGNPRYQWRAEIDPAKAARQLRAGGVDVGELKYVKILSRSRSGRAETVRVAGTKGHADMKSNRFRILMDSRVIRSTQWTALSCRRNVWRFEGRGWGHGVGLCQWGAKAMAEKGWDHGDILRYYYKHISLQEPRA